MLKPFKSTCIHRSQFLEFASKLKSQLQHLRFIKFSIQFSDMLLVERRNMIGLFFFLITKLFLMITVNYLFIYLWEVNVKIKIYLFAIWRLSRERWWKVLFVEVMRIEVFTKVLTPVLSKQSMAAKYQLGLKQALVCHY